MGKITLKNLIALIIALSTVLVQAAAPPPPVPPPPPGLPIDGRIMVLLSISIIFVAYKFYSLQNKKA